MTATTVVVAGALANKPGNGGEAWVVLSWARGLRDLGFDVWFVEEINASGGQCPAGAVAWFGAVTQAHGLGGRAILACGDRVFGADRMGDVRDLIGSAALVVNISGNLRRPDLFGVARRAAYVDLDPGFTQIWHADRLGDLGIDRHHLHFTIGENIGGPSCRLPTAGVQWVPTRQPIVLSDWRVSPVPAGAPFTTVATWRCGFGTLVWDGIEYGLKVHEFRKLVDVPRNVGGPLELALHIDEGDRADRLLLEGHGWRLQDAASVAGTPDAFRSYVEGSLGEFSAVQGVYAAARTGWFSDRSARYLASGRPVVVQNTTLANDIPVGDGLLVFDDAIGAAAALDEVLDDPQRHGRAARQIAEQFFESSKVLTAFVERCGLEP
jgi:hypothetical protein